MNFFKQTTLIGIGLIGSSIARALKKKRLSKKICIFSKTTKTINKNIVDATFAFIIFQFIRSCIRQIVSKYILLY